MCFPQIARQGPRGGGGGSAGSVRVADKMRTSDKKKRRRVAQMQTLCVVQLRRFTPLHAAWYWERRWLEVVGSLRMKPSVTPESVEPNSYSVHGRGTVRADRRGARCVLNDGADCIFLSAVRKRGRGSNLGSAPLENKWGGKKVNEIPVERPAGVKLEGKVALMPISFHKLVSTVPSKKRKTGHFDCRRLTNFCLLERLLA